MSFIGNLFFRVKQSLFLRRLESEFDRKLKNEGLFTALVFMRETKDRAFAKLIETINTTMESYAGVVSKVLTSPNLNASDLDRLAQKFVTCRDIFNKALLMAERTLLRLLRKLLKTMIILYPVCKKELRQSGCIATKQTKDLLSPTSLDLFLLR